jgi:hypothetical protein
MPHANHRLAPLRSSPAPGRTIARSRVPIASP